MVLAVGTCRIGAALWTGFGSPDFILEATRMAGIFSFCFPNTFLSAAATAETAGREREKRTRWGSCSTLKQPGLLQGSPKPAQNVKPAKKKKKKFKTLSA